MGSRERGNPKAVAWVQAAGGGAAEGTFADAAASAEIVINATNGGASLAALRAAGAQSLRGKVLMDVANPLRGDTGFPPQLAVCNDDSLGEQIQREFPEARVVKTLNTVNAAVMVAPRALPEPSTIFLSGDDDAAKREVRSVLGSLGWQDGEVVDLGGIETARGTEMYLPLWLRLLRVMGGPSFNIRLVRSG
jgi:predicted dinucleotide-binding enzyme